MVFLTSLSFEVLCFSTMSICMNTGALQPPCLGRVFFTHPDPLAKSLLLNNGTRGIRVRGCPG